MKKIFKLMVFITLAVIMITTPVYGTDSNYIIKKDVISGAGGLADSTNYQLKFTLAQSSPIGKSSTDSYLNYAGFWNPDQTSHTLTLLTTNDERLKNSKCKIKINETIQNLPYEGDFNKNSEITLEAVPEYGWQFTHWSGDITDSANPLQLVITDNKTITAQFFELTRFTLALTGNGQVYINDELYDLPWSDSFIVDSTVTVKGYPDGEIYEIVMDDNKDLIITGRPLWETAINLQGRKLGGQNHVNITIGVGPDEITIDSPPASPAFSCALAIIPVPDMQTTINKYIQKHGDNTYHWALAVNPHGNLGPPVDETATLSWNPDTFYDQGFYMLHKGYDGKGEVVISDMRSITEYEVTGKNENQYFSVVWIDEYCIEFNLKSGWNLISLPLTPEHAGVLNLFPDAIAVYAFDDGGYAAVDTLEPGKGYWIKMAEEKSYEVCGEPFTNYTVTLDSGWHLIGAVHIKTTPDIDPDNAVSVMYEYNEGRYKPITQFTPKYGCWVKTVKECNFTLGY